MYQISRVVSFLHPQPPFTWYTLLRLEARERLVTYNTIDDVVNLIRASKRILVLTGAGISESHCSRVCLCGVRRLTLPRVPARSFALAPCVVGVSCGIPDFRSRNGLYASLQESGEYDLNDPQEMSVGV